MARGSDGVGVSTVVPRALLLRETGVALADDEPLGVGMLFLPVEETRAEALLERCIQSQDLKVLCWRDVPIDISCLGEIALKHDAEDPAGAGGGCGGDAGDDGTPVVPGAEAV